MLFRVGLGWELEYDWVGEEGKSSERVLKISCSESSSGGVEEEEDWGSNKLKNLPVDGELLWWFCLRKRVASPRNCSIGPRVIVCVSESEGGGGLDAGERLSR